MKSLTVACVFVRGHVPFTPEYVVRLKSMATRTMPDHRFVCLTDRADELPGDIETIGITAPKGVFAWWAKLQLFNHRLPLRGRILYLDLDVLLIGDIEEIVHYPAKFALAPDGAPGFQPRDGKRCVHKFNSSVMVWDHGVHPDLFSEWTPDVATRLWGDQDWIGERCPTAHAMPLEWFPRLSTLQSKQWPAGSKVVLCKKPKNKDAVAVFPWFDEVWQ